MKTLRIAFLVVTLAAPAAAQSPEPVCSAEQYGVAQLFVGVRAGTVALTCGHGGEHRACYPRRSARAGIVVSDLALGERRARSVRPGAHHRLPLAHAQPGGVQRQPVHQLLLPPRYGLYAGADATAGLLAKWKDTVAAFYAANT